MAQKIAPNKNRVIVGLGLTGLSCAQFFSARKLPFVIMDSRNAPPALAQFRQKFPHVPCVLGRLDKEILCAADEIVVSPGVALEEEPIAQAIKQGVAVKGDIDLFREVIKKPLIAITGSNGKTTVTTLVGEMAKAAQLRVAVAGNIGVPVLDLLDEYGAERDDIDLYVLELSSFQLERLQTLAAEVAVVLNVSADHMDRYDSLQAYHAAKQRIFIGARQAVVNRRDKLSEPLGREKVQRVSFGLDEPTGSNFGVIARPGGQYLAAGKQLLMPVDKLKIPGQHNMENALAALALGHCAGFPMDSMLQVLEGFSGLPHRCQFVRSYQGVDYFNDSKGTNVGATVAAVEGLCATTLRKVVLIAGGDGKGADFSPLADVVSQYVRAAVLIGKAAQELAETLREKIKTVFAETMDSAVRSASTLAEPGDIVLLSPACASFDMFKGYEDRGNAFVAAVAKLAVEEGV